MSFLTDTSLTATSPDRLPLISARNLLVHRSGRPVLQEVFLDIHAGQRVYVMGENGAGKSTLLETLLGLHTRLVGTVHWLGRTVTPFQADAFRRGDVFYLRQFDNLFPSLTLEENMMIGNADASDQQQKRYAAVLSQLPVLRHLWKRYPGEMSAGERQLASCARLLVRNPRLVVLDEPMAGISAALIPALYDHFRTATNGHAAFLFTDQNTSIAQKWATVTYRLHGGKLQAI